MLRNLGRSKRAVGKRLEMAREAMGLTQTEFARHLGKGQGTVSGWETAKKPLGLESALAVCDKFPLTLDYLYRGFTSGIPDDLEMKLKRVKQAQ